MAKKEKLGDCFERAYNLFVNGTAKGQHVVVYFGKPMLVHGIVTDGKAPPHSHGWVEDNIFCYDFLNGELKAIPKDRYYEIGNIKTGEGEIFRYDEQSAMAKANEVGYYYFSKLPCNC